MGLSRAPGIRAPKTRKRIFLYLTSEDGDLVVVNLDHVEAMIPAEMSSQQKFSLESWTRIFTQTREYLVKESVADLERVAGFETLSPLPKGRDA